MEKPTPTRKLSYRKIFASNLRRYRRMRDIPQEKLALDADMSRSYLSGVERAARNISIDNMEKLSVALGVPLTVLLDETLFEGVENRDR